VDLFDVASQDADAVSRVVALRGCVKLLSLPANRPAQETVGLLDKAMKAASRIEEKRVVLAALPNYPCPAALDLATRMEADPAMAQEAKLAATKIKELLVNQKLSAKASINNGDVKNALDGNKATRWATGRGMQPGDWFMIDMGTENQVSGLTLDAAGSTGDYPRGYEVYVSFDGETWGKPVVTGNSDKALTVIEFPQPVRARFIKIVQTGSVPNLFWSIHDLKIHFE
jgi:hypothetical protein